MKLDLADGAPGDADVGIGYWLQKDFGLHVYIMHQRGKVADSTARQLLTRQMDGCSADC